MAASAPLGVVAVLVYPVASLRNMKIYSSAQEEGTPFDEVATKTPGLQNAFVKAIRPAGLRPRRHADRASKTVTEERRTTMVRFILGAVAGGLAVWFWGDQVRAFAESKTKDVRVGAIDTLQAVEKRLQAVEKRTEQVLDRTKEHVSAALQAGQRTLSAVSNRSGH